MPVLISARVGWRFGDVVNGFDKDRPDQVPFLDPATGRLTMRRIPACRRRASGCAAG